MSDAYERAACGLLTTTSRGVIERANRTFYAWTGYSANELAGKKFQDLLTVGSKLFHHTQWMPLLQLQGSISEVQLELVTKAGRAVPVLVNAANRDGIDSDVDIAVFVATDRRTYERQLVEARRRAEQLLVSERAAQEALASAVQRLEQKNRELDSFAYVASHDLKAPLRALGNVVSWLREDEAPRLSNEGRGHLDLLESRVAHLAKLIDGMLRFARAGSENDEVTLVPMKELVQHALDVLSIPPTTRVEVGDLPTLRGSRVLLEQILLNLLSNALKHASGDEARVEVDAVESEGQWRFSIRDNGPGIAPRDHERIWRLFESLHPGDGESSGIGLSIVKKIVEGGGGRAWVDSELGRGATFYFTWPMPPKT